MISFCIYLNIVTLVVISTTMRSMSVFVGHWREFSLLSIYIYGARACAEASHPLGVICMCDKIYIRAGVLRVSSLFISIILHVRCGCSSS